MPPTIAEILADAREHGSTTDLRALLDYAFRQIPLRAPELNDWAAANTETHGDRAALEALSRELEPLAPAY